jgi:thiol-disulfide isomerase/thioredoxin
LGNADRAGYRWSTMEGVLLLLAVLGAATAFGLWRARTDGRMRHVAHAEPGGPPPTPGDDSEPLLVDGLPVTPADHSVIPRPDALTATELGADLGERATLVQFSSAFCQPCRATRVVLTDVAELVPGVAHIEVDAESHLELVRRLDVTRTPTVLVLDAGGRIRTRATGAPRKRDVLAALADVV